MLHEASVSISAQRNAKEISDRCEALAKAEHTESQDHAFRVYKAKDDKLAQQAIENSQLSLKLAEMESAAMIHSEERQRQLHKENVLRQEQARTKFLFQQIQDKTHEQQQVAQRYEALKLESRKRHDQLAPAALNDKDAKDKLAMKLMIAENKIEEITDDMNIRVLAGGKV